MPRRCSVGARFSSTGCSAITSSRTSQTSGVIESTYFFAALMFCTVLRSTSRLMMDGFKGSAPPHHAPGQGPVAARNIAAELGVGKAEDFDYRGDAAFVNLGRYKAVGRV